MGRSEEAKKDLRSRNDYFREYYAAEGTVETPGVETLFFHQGLFEAAHSLFGLPVIVPRIVYANLLLPGQELGVHTDVPEFRLEPMAPVPLWLRVVMHHSGLFENWRIPVATAVIFIRESQGGDFAFYRDGPDGSPATIRPEAGSVVVLEAETIFHGVDSVGSPDEPSPTVVAGSKLVSDGNGNWKLSAPPGNPDLPTGTYPSDQIRVSMSWKAFCFADESERQRWFNRVDIVPTGNILPALISELESRGCLPGGRNGIDDTELGLRLIAEFVRFPGTPAPAQDA